MHEKVECQIVKIGMEAPGEFIQAVMGDRQIGQSTAVKQVLKDISIPYQLFSADNVPATDSAWISNRRAAARSLKENSGYGKSPSC